MATNGNRQATIAYKQSKTGAPLDVDGLPTNITGKRQAIMLLHRYTNPNPAAYEVQGYFYPGAIIDGVPTIAFRPDICPVGHITVSPNRLYFETTGWQTLTVDSTHRWQVVVEPQDTSKVMIETLSGPGGVTQIRVRASPPNWGKYQITFQNMTTREYATVWVEVLPSADAWILATGRWDDRGIWRNTAFWNSVITDPSPAFWVSARQPITVSPAGGWVDIGLTTNDERFRVVSSESWILDILPSSGTAGQNVSVNIAPNLTGLDRTARLTLTSVPNGAVFYAIINQNA